MRARAAILGLVATAALAGPAAARGDVPIRVPARFLGGPIRPRCRRDRPSRPPPAAPRAPPPPPIPARVRLPATAWCSGRAPRSTSRRCRPRRAPARARVPPDEEPDTPGRPGGRRAPLVSAELVRAAPAIPPAAADLAAAFGGLLAPGPASWLRWQTPVLRWRPAAGARYYNVQVFRGPHRVVNAWSRAPRLRLPAGALEQGRTYVWTVWPGAGPRRGRATARPSAARCSG